LFETPIYLFLYPPDSPFVKNHVFLHEIDTIKIIIKHTGQ